MQSKELENIDVTSLEGSIGGGAEEENFLFIHERPEGMKFEEYKKVRKESQVFIKSYLKGTLIHESTKTTKLGKEGITFKGKCDIDKDIKLTARKIKNGK